MAAAFRAGDREGALSRLGEMLRLMSRTPYYRALATERSVGVSVLRTLLAGTPDAALRQAGEDALAHLEDPVPPPAAFSDREIEVLAAARRGLRNRGIADSLGITADGVRYHLRNIYRKTGTSRRREAVRCAEALGLLD